MAKEAFLKAVGTGFLAPAHDVEFALDDQLNARLRGATGKLADFYSQNWCLRNVKIGGTYRAIVLCDFEIEKITQN
jgi:mRNA-degrading endonuclease HigB of HigAB toxin-antitoxin module